MQELQELRTHIEQGRYADALVLLGEMEEMSRSDKVNKVRSFIHILLLHLIKQRAENRTTRSWDVSIRNALREIEYTNKREKAGGYFLDAEVLQELIEQTFEATLDHASLEAFGGVYDTEQLTEMIDAEQIGAQALDMILAGQKSS